MEESLSKSRRNFIRQSALALAAGCLLPTSRTLATGSGELKLTILHTNDVHSRIDPFEDNHPKYPGMGGVAIRSALIKKIRGLEKNVLLFDAGDFFQGTPYYNMFGGEPEIKLMSYMKYDAATIGNHDFDHGMDGLAKQLTHARFPLINANYEFAGTIMEGKSVPYKIFVKEGIKVGVFGLGVELAGLVDKRLFGKTKYFNPVAVSDKISAYLKHRKKCHLVVCLSHLGYQYKNNKISDLLLAKSSRDIDLIIGGHTHTFLDEPVKETNSEGREVLVTQAGFAGLRLGRLDYHFKRITGEKIKFAASMIEMNKSSEI